MNRTRTVAKDAGIVMLLILASRLLGFFRERAIADVFGVSEATDAFRSAFLLPDFMYFLLIAGGLNAAFVPVFSEYLAKDEEESAWRLAGTFLGIIVLILLVMVALGMLFTEAFTPLVAYGYQGEQRELLAQLIRFMFPAVFFTAMAGVGMGVHRAYRSYSMPMWGPIAYNAAIIASIYLLGQRLGVVGMAWGTVAGAILNFAIQLPFVLKKAIGRFKIDLAHPGLRRVLRLMGPAVISLSIYQFNFTLNSNLASGLPEGAPTAMRIGQTIVQLPLGVFAMAIGMVLLPTLSRLIAKGEMSAFKDTFSQGLRAVYFVMIPSAVGLAVLREPLIRLLFETGEFNADDTRLSAYALLFFTVGIWAQAAIQVLTQVYYSLQETAALVKVSVVAIVVNAALSFLLLRFTPWGLGALALALSLTSIVNMLNYLYLLKKRIGSVDGRRLVRTVLQSAGASALMALVVWLFSTLYPQWINTSGTMGQIFHVGLSILVGAAVYLIAAKALKMEELTFARALVTRDKSAAAEHA